MKTTIAVLAGLVLAVSAQAQLGTVTFANTPSNPVINFYTGLPAGPGVAIAGLYYAPTGTVPDTSVPLDGFSLAATTVVAPNAVFVGVYSGGDRGIPGTIAGDTVLLQVRAWSAAYGSYEAAMNNGASTSPVGLAGASNLMTVTLGGNLPTGGTVPIPSLSTRVLGFTITPVPEPSTVVLGLLGGLGAMVLLRRHR